MGETGEGYCIHPLFQMEVLQHKPRATTVLAVRFSQLAKVPEGLLNFIKMKYPQVWTSFHSYEVTVSGSRLDSVSFSGWDSTTRL